MDWFLWGSLLVCYMVWVACAMGIIGDVEGV